MCIRDSDCSDHAALFIKQADKVFLTLAEGTENTLSSGSSYALGDDDSNCLLYTSRCV